MLFLLGTLVCEASATLPLYFSERSARERATSYTIMTRLWLSQGELKSISRAERVGTLEIYDFPGGS